MHIVFWSNVHGQTGTTSNLVTFALELALNYRFKILLMHNEYIKGALDSMFLSEYQLSKDEAGFDVGIDGLIRFSKFNKLDEEEFSNYTTDLLKGKLELLKGTSSISKDKFYEAFDEVSENIYYNSDKFYDFIITDASAGDNYSKKILKESDLIVVNLNQNPNVIKDFLKSDVYKYHREKCFYIMGVYNSNSRNNLNNLIRKYELLRDSNKKSKIIGRSNNVGVVEYNIEFSDACGEGKIIEFFLQNSKINKNDLNYEFFTEVKRTTKLILDKVGIDKKLNKLGEYND